MIGTSLLANSIGALIVPLQYQQRVLNDGGTIADNRGFSVYFEVTAIKQPTLLCAGDAYKVALLYSVIVFSDIYDFVQSVTVENEAFLIEKVHELFNKELYEDTSLFSVCVAGDAGNLYAIKPN